MALKKHLLSLPVMVMDHGRPGAVVELKFLRPEQIKRSVQLRLYKGIITCECGLIIGYVCKELI